MTAFVRRFAPILGVGALGAAALAVVSVHDPESGGVYPPCISAMVGIACPLCGGLRGTHDLMRGDLEAMLDHNALLPLYLVTLLALYLGWAWTRFRGRSVIGPRTLSRIAISIVFASLSFGVLRNVIPFLAPGAV